MTEENLSFSPSSDGTDAKSNLAFAKIASLPTQFSWSQAYNAGRLFAVISIKRESLPEEETQESLSQIGRNVLDRLEKEFFATETKTLSSIKQAIEITLQSLPDDTVSSIAVAHFTPHQNGAGLTDSILYLYAIGGAKIFIKRGGKFGTILESQDLNQKTISSSSGPIEENDLIVLATKSFSEVIDPVNLSSTLDNLPPAEIAEALAPKVHEKEEGSAAAFIIKYAKQEQVLESSNYPEAPETIESDKQPSIQAKDKLSIKLNHSKKVYLTIAVVILIILLSSIFFAVKKQNDSKDQALFKEIYANALKNYEEGNSLLDLNANLAKENLTASKDLIEENKSEFKKDSKEQEQLLELLKKVNEGLRKLEQNISFFLKTQVDSSADGPKASFFSQDENFVYMLDEKGISSIDKKSSQTKILIKNDSWKSPSGIGVYLGNLYLLDKGSNQILKFVQEGDEFTKSNYFGDSSPDLENAVDLAIDGSIWILFNDGSVQKFLSGTRDEFSLSGLDKPLINPAKIFTEKDIDNLYILDNGNSRVVVIAKDGKYVSEYSHDAIKNARDFEVLESSKKIYVLSQNKIYEIGIK